MGGGSWTNDAFCSYACRTGRGYNVSSKTYDTNYTCSSQAYTSRRLDESLDPKNVMRECCDSKEHPYSFPIILALDVTGSMGNTAIKVQKQLNPIMEDIYKNIDDAEIAIMAIGDLAYDGAPIQMSQFESDIRIAENLDKVYFEGGGGGNSYESYTAAWYMGAYHTKLDCWNRGKKGIIITMGDEPLNPYLPVAQLNECVNDQIDMDIDTNELYDVASKKFEIYHICVKSQSYPNQDSNRDKFAKVIGSQNVFVSDVDSIHKTIMAIVKDASERNSSGGVNLIVESKTKANVDENGEISW